MSSEEHEAKLDETMSTLVGRSKNVIWFIIWLLTGLVVGLCVVVVILLGIVTTSEDQLHHQATQLSRVVSKLNKQQNIINHETDNVIRTLHRNQASKCTFYKVIGTAPVPAKPFPDRRTAEVVLAARGVFIEDQCSGKLGPASKVIQLAAAKYHLSLHPK